VSGQELALRSQVEHLERQLDALRLAFARLAAQRGESAPEGATVVARAWANLARVDELIGAGRRARPVLVVLQGGG
jgi:hypothetical protein